MSAARPEGLCRGLTFIRPLHKSFGMMQKSKGDVRWHREGHRVPWVEGGEQGRLFTLAAQSTLCGAWQVSQLARPGTY